MTAEHVTGFAARTGQRCMFAMLGCFYSCQRPRQNWHGTSLPSRMDPIQHRALVWLLVGAAVASVGSAPSAHAAGMQLCTVPPTIGHPDWTGQPGYFNGAQCVPRPNSNCSDATAACRDGTCSHSQHRSGTCSRHGGVGTWNPGSLK